jgi:hypothetical protein
MFKDTLADEEKEIPATIAAAPDLESVEQFIYDGFFDLGRSGMGGGPSYSERIAWLDANHISSWSDRAYVLRCWQRMEPLAEELNEERSKRENKSSNKGKSAPTMGSHK